MKKIIAVLIILTSFITNYAMAEEEMTSEAETAFYVATNGNDENPGTLELPFATIDKARDSIRDLKNSSGLPDGGISVYVRGGVYSRKNSLSFTSEDSGTEASPIVYKAYNGEKPIISGGVYISGSDFKTIDSNDINYSRILPETDKSKIKVLKLSDYTADYKGRFLINDTVYNAWEAYGRGASAIIPGSEVYIDSKAADMARWPNRDANKKTIYSTFGAEVAPQSGNSFYSKGAVYQYNDNRINNWATTKYANIVNVNGYWDEASVFTANTTAKTVSLSHAGEYPFHTAEGYNFYYRNVFEELDHENEYYIDIDNGLLYIYSENDIANSEISVSTFGISKDASLVSFEKAEYITLDSLEISLSRANGITLYSGRNITVKDCIIKNIGKDAICTINLNSARGIGYGFYHNDIGKEVYLANAGYNYLITGCEIYNCGKSGIDLRGGDRIDLDACNHVIENCSISKVGRIQVSMGWAIQAVGVGMTVRGCTLSDVPMCAVDFGCNDFIFEYNELYNCMYEGYDMGVMYSSAYMAEINAGAEIRYNYFHDVPNEFSGLSGMAKNGYKLGIIGNTPARPAIYNDNCQPFLSVHHNVFADMPLGGIFGGYENNWENNIFINVDKPMWMLYNNLLAEVADENDENAVFDSRIGTREFEALDNAAWRAKYPKVFEVKEIIKEKGIEAANSEADIKGNFCFFYTNSDECNPQLGEKESITQNLRKFNNTFTKANPGFANIENKDYTPDKDSRMYCVNPQLKKINLSMIGCNKTEEVTVKNTVALKIGSPVAALMGKPVAIESDNSDICPIIVDGTTLVPLKFLSEKLGAKVTWDPTEMKATVKSDCVVICFKINETSYTVKGLEKELTTAPIIKDGRTFVPLRAVAEAMGKEVTWLENGVVVVSDSPITEKTAVEINNVLN